MADGKFVESPMVPIANPPAGYGGTGGGEFDGELLDGGPVLTHGEWLAAKMKLNDEDV